ncbi:hypothetical protein [Glycomyces sp. NRRL B-16210]|uniref:hypothetical protein n=1 Tax=Glycomyces sp. NRRL B-16210 TaxID=1463821 RepID=UPI00068E7CAE|nr:hypothetical protein [Glycomyces sp. NRRL B-16210]
MPAGKLPRKGNKSGSAAEGPGSAPPSYPSADDQRRQLISQYLESKPKGADPEFTPEERRAADEFLARSARNEPAITDRMRDIADGTGARLEGLDFRLKGKSSFDRKFNDVLDEHDGNIDAARADMKDAVRYTMIFEEDNYVDGVSRAESMMKDKGFEPVKWKNLWNGEGYNGVNSFWRDPETGQVFEAQFHTQSSFDVKMAEHEAYEVARDGDAPAALQRTATELANEAFATIPKPSGFESLDR